jgi:hypothetical protein
MTLDKHITTYIIPLIEYRHGKKIINNTYNTIMMNELIKSLHKICFEDKPPVMGGFIFEMVGEWKEYTDRVTVII